MNLQEHIDILGWNEGGLAFRTKIEKAVIKRALAGQPITKRHADTICRKIGMEFGHHPTPANGLKDYQIDGLVTVGK